jgi:hypothetical protein
LLNILPPFKQINKIAGVDRYGFSSLLAKICGRRSVPRSFANWIHGWAWSEEAELELLSCNKLPRDLTIVVSRESEQLALKVAGFTDIRIGGLPFAYVQRQHTSCQENSLLAFPPHSTEAGHVSADQGAYFDYLESIKNDFEYLYVSVHYLDFNGPLHKAALARGLKVVQGARPDDANSLLRMRSILDSFTHVTSNVIGSHMLYSLFAGCKFSFCGPIYSYDESIFRSAGYKSTDHLVKIFSEYYIREKFSEYFTNHPRMGLENKNFAKNSIGEKFIMLPHEIEDALGWTVGGQIKGYVKGASRRLSPYLYLKRPPKSDN